MTADAGGAGPSGSAGFPASVAELTGILRDGGYLADRGLAQRADALPAALSSGQLQALLLACALVRPRDLLVLDEPEQRLDPDARRRLAELLKAELADGVAVLFVTHHTDLALEVADRVLVLEDGRTVADGSPHDVLPHGPGETRR